MATGASLSAAGRAYVGAVGVAGLAVVALSVARLLDGDVPPHWLLFALLTLASGGLTVRVPSVQARLSVSETFGFTCLLLFGPEVAAVTFVAEALLLSLRLRYTLPQTVFNFGNLPLSMWCAGTVFFLLSDLKPLFNAPSPDAGVLVALAAMSVTCFLVNTGLTAIALALESRRTPLGLWREHFLWLAPGYAAAASVALLLVLALRQVHFSVIAVVPPLLFLSYFTLRSALGRLEDAQRHLAKLNRLYLSTVETLATAIDAKDEVTHGHVRRVQSATVALARELGVNDAQTLQAIEAAALLHDTGKIAVPEHILNKPGRLTPAEFEKMKLHAPVGAQILSSIDFPYPVVPIVRHHHENWDGSGYPDGLRGADIPLGARILAVVDCFDALTSDRPYRRRMTDEEALRIIVERRGTMYDPLVVDTFVSSYQRIMPPAGSSAHPAAQAIDDARKNVSSAGAPAAPAADVPVADDVLAFTSLSRAFSGDATLADVGALLWMMVRHVVPCQAMALFLKDEQTDVMAAAYAAGTHAGSLRQLRTPMAHGVVGWTAVTRRAVANAPAALDAEGERPLEWMLAMPLVHDSALAAVLTLYSESTPFSEDQARLLDLLAPRMAAAVAALNVRSAEPRLAFDRRAPRAGRTSTLRAVP